jgi:hypothetical protein
MACLMTLSQLYRIFDVKCIDYYGWQILTNLVQPILIYESEAWTTTTEKLMRSAYFDGRLQEKYVDP